MEMQLQTISTVSKNLGISTRMLRYYEQIGLIESKRKENYSYRVYDELTIKRLRQIILLRKLRIPMKQIKDILEKQEITEVIIEVFQQNISELNKEISDLFAIRDILNGFISLLEGKTNIKSTFDLLNDESVLNVIASINLSKNHIKEEKSIMEELNKTIEVQLGYSLIPLVEENQGDLAERVTNLKQKIAADMGVVVDYFTFTDNQNLNPNSYTIKVKGKKVAIGEVHPHRFLIMEALDQAVSMLSNFDGIGEKEPSVGLPAKWISPTEVEKATTLGYTVIDPQSVILTHLNEIIKNHASEF
jgi:flagellar biosynthesis component FlhA